MATTTVTVHVDMAAIERLTRSTGGTVQQAVLRTLNRSRNNSHNRCPVDTGYLRSRIAIREADAPGGWELYDDAEYAVYVHEGTRYMTGRPFLRDAITEEMRHLV